MKTSKSNIILSFLSCKNEFPFVNFLYKKDILGYMHTQYKIKVIRIVL